jgi:hypothetical protein
MFRHVRFQFQGVAIGYVSKNQIGTGRLTGKGSRTANCSLLSSQENPSDMGCAFWLTTPIAPASMDWNHPVEPNQVDTIMPDELCICVFFIPLQARGKSAVKSG